MIYLYPLFAAIIWGMDYAIAEKLLEKISLNTLAFFQLSAAALVFLVVSFVGTSLKNDFLVLSKDSTLLMWFLISLVTFTLGFYLVFKAVDMSNATLAGLIEISYPVFIILASWLLFQKNHVSPSILVGGSLIFLGVFIIYYFDKA